MNILLNITPKNQIRIVKLNENWGTEPNSGIMFLQRKHNTERTMPHAENYTRKMPEMQQ